MRIGLVGPDVWLKETHKRISNDFPDIQFIPFPYHRPIELLDMLSGEQSRCDLFLFMGETARRWAARQITPVVPWLGIPRSAAAFLRILVQAAYQGYPPKFITDYQDPSYFKYVLDEAGISPDKSYFFIIPSGIFTAEGYMENNAELMMKEFQKGKAAFCATIFSGTYDLLVKNHIPAYYFIPCFEDTKHAVQEIIASAKSFNNVASGVAVMSIHINLPQYLEWKNNDSGTTTRARLLIAQQIYDFSYRLNASCVPLGFDEFMIYSTRAPLKAATHNFTQIDLLRTASDVSELSVSIGIGCGTSVLKAENRARKAMALSLFNDGSCAYFIGDKNSLLGPIRYGIAAPVQETSDQLISIARKTGISFNYLKSIYELCKREHRRVFTPSELADACGIRKRTMSRIILKLMDSGYCVEKGHTFPKKKGRPSRIIELHFEKGPSDGNE